MSAEKSSPDSTNEVVSNAERLNALNAKGLLDAPAEAALDRMTAFAAKVLQVPTALISLVDRDRQFFASHCGLAEDLATARQSPLSHSICKYAVGTGEAVIVSDARTDPLTRDNGGVHDYGVAAHAGIPLIDANGFRLGSFCAIDTKPRRWTVEEVDLLRAVAAQVMTEIELRAKTARLDRALSSAQLLEAHRRDLTRLTAHDLRTPLNSLLLSLEMLPVVGPLNAEQEDYLGLCARAGETLRSVVDSLLDLEARALQGRAGLVCAPCDPSGLALRALDQVKTLAAENRLVLEHQIPRALPSVNVDGEKIAHVLVSLLAHAIRSTPPSGTVRLNLDLDDDYGVVFGVSDSGGGLDAEALARVFENDGAAGENGPTQNSAGLTLHACKRIVEAHRGSIRAETAREQGKGLTFTVNLPSHKNRAG